MEELHTNHPLTCSSIPVAQTCKSNKIGMTRDKELLNMDEGVAKGAVYAPSVRP